MQRRRSEIKSGATENKIGHTIFIILPRNISISPPSTSPSFAAISFSVCSQLRFDAAVIKYSIVLFRRVVTSETSTDNW